MKSYLVHIECEDYINVEANSDEEAKEMAIAEANSSLNHDWKADIAHSIDFDEEEEES